MDKIHLNQKNYHFTEKDLPCLVHYAQGTGGSHFTMTMIADLFMSGSKILFLTAFPMARENFMKQVSGYEDKVVYVTKGNQLDHHKQAIIIESGNQELFLEALNISDIQERVILIKNFEVFDNETIQKATLHNKIIISGDVDASAVKGELQKKKYQTIIQFSQPSTHIEPTCPNLTKHTGYLWQNGKSGLVTVVYEP